MRKVLRWNASKTEIVSFRCRLILERDGTMSGPRLTERRIDVGTTTNVGESGPNGLERGSNGPRRRVVRFFVPVIRTAFLVQRSFCIVREREEELERPPNEVGTEGAGGQKWDGFPLRKHSFRPHFSLVPLSF